MGAKVFAYRPLGPGCPCVADNYDVGCAEATCVHVNACCSAVVEDASVLGKKPVVCQFELLVCRLELLPQWGMGVKVAVG